MKKKFLLSVYIITLGIGVLQSCNKEEEERLLERPKKELTEGQCPINHCNPEGRVFSCKKDNNTLSVCLVERSCPECAGHGTPPSGRF